MRPDRVRTKSVRGLPDQTYLELVRSLFAALAPMTIMAALFIVTARQSGRQTCFDVADY